MENYDFKQTEEEILSYWTKNNIYAKVKAKRAGGKSYYFLDGPPYTSGKVHVGTAWNKSLKDMILRFKRSQGLNVWDRAGYDMHGLPTENATEKKLGLHGKEDIKKFGVDKFIAECKNLCITNMEVMNQDFKKMGVWMDFDNAYQSIKDEFIEGEWWLIKKAHENERLYEGLKTMTWCPDCATALAKHECEYQDVIDTSIFVKFKVKSSGISQGDNDYLVIWTTTPWTIPFNLAVMVGPEIDYVKIRINKDTDESWIVAKDLLESVLEEKKLKLEDVEVIKKFKGKDLEGIKYEHPFKLNDYKALEKNHPKLHSVILSEKYVDTSAGSGLVHCAPGCGPEDYEVGLKNGLPAYNSIDQYGVFPETMQEFSGKTAKKDDDYFIEALEKQGALISKKQYAHDYAHCWRCHSPVIFRTTKQWFFKIEDLKPKLIEENNKISWVPKAAYNAFDSWLNNLRDNSITKQRFWGTPLPVWKCDTCENYEVVGNKEELKKFAGKLPKDLHKPYIDEIEFKCTNKGCKGTMKRIPDILDVWVDAGTTSWNCLDFPKDEKKFKELFPADFILEGKDQIRGWFNLLHLTSMISMGKPSFKACYMHGFVNDSQGRKMSKSIGNYILPSEIIDKYGADTMRYYMIGAASPGLDMSYNMDDVEVKHRNLFVIWNTAKFLLQQVNDPYELLSQKDLKNKDLQEEELYILSRLNSTIKLVSEKINNYELNEIPWLIEKLFLDLSREYIKIVRNKTSTDSGKELVVQVAGRVFFEALKLFSTIAPMISEKIFLEIKDSFLLEEKSISFYDYPVLQEDLINESIEQEYSIALDLVGAIFSARDSSRLGVRWPSAKVLFQTKDEEIKKVIKNFEALIKRQANVKEIDLGSPEFSYEIKLNFKTTGNSFGQETAEIATYVKENMPKVQKDFNEAFSQGEEPETFKVGERDMKKEHFKYTKAIEEGWALGEFNKGSAYLYTVLDDDLEAEGFTREIIRRMQQLRKEANLTKSDKVDFAFSGELTEVVKANKKDIANIVGSSEIYVLEDEKHHLDLKKSEKVKGKEFVISLRKI